MMIIVGVFEHGVLGAIREHPFFQKPLHFFFDVVYS